MDLTCGAMCCSILSSSWKAALAAREASAAALEAPEPDTSARLDCRQDYRTWPFASLHSSAVLVQCVERWSDRAVCTCTTLFTLPPSPHEIKDAAYLIFAIPRVGWGSGRCLCAACKLSVSCLLDAVGLPHEHAVVVPAHADQVPVVVREPDTPSHHRSQHETPR